jgi:hypothetical protein
MTSTPVEEIVVQPTPYPTGFMWWFRNGDSWHAPDINQANDGPQPYLPNIKIQILRDFLWFCRNPIGNFMGFVIGFEGRGYTVRGPAPVLLTTLYDAQPHQYGWKWSVINGWAPFVSYSGVKYLWYFGWRPASGGFGFKFNIHTGDTSA